jgi:hypothetical protein
MTSTIGYKIRLLEKVNELIRSAIVNFNLQFYYVYRLL